MGNEELMVTIPVKRFEELVAIETGARIVKRLAMETSYSVERKDIARALNFEFPANKDEGGQL